MSECVECKVCRLKGYISHHRVFYIVHRQFVFDFFLFFALDLTTKRRKGQGGLGCMDGWVASWWWWWWWLGMMMVFFFFFSLVFSSLL